VLHLFAGVGLIKNLLQVQVATIAITAMQRTTTVGAGMPRRTHLARHKTAKVTVIAAKLKATVVGAAIR